MSPETPIIYTKELPSTIREAYNHVKTSFGLEGNQLVLISGASLLPFLHPYVMRPITDIDFIISPNNSSTQSDLSIDIRSVPWGMIFVNPLTTLPFNGRQIDVLNQMVHLHLNKPMRGFLYRLNFKDFLLNSIEINGIRVADPEITVLYKLMNWRNGVYSGWDRVKRDIEDIQALLYYGTISYESVIETIEKLVPDPNVAKILVERLNQALTKDPPNMIDTSKLASQRLWGRPELPPDILKEIKRFLETEERYTWLELPESLTI